MDVQISKITGDSFTFEENGIIAKDFIVSSISLRAISSEIEGRHGKVDYGATYGTRTITVPFYFKAQDEQDFPLVRDILFSLVIDAEPFYIQELRKQTGVNQLLWGKRYLVRLQNTFNIDQIIKVGQGELVYETVDLPFAESIGTTQDIQSEGINSDNALWGFSMGLIEDPDSLIYTHTTNQFRIYNAGNVPIHPFEQDLKITISNVVGSTSFMELNNQTNGTGFRVNEMVTNSQTIIINGPEITSNGLQYTRKTNKGFIELEPGWNAFLVSGVTGAKVEFDFPFYYK
jgi:phage-related protein